MRTILACVLISFLLWGCADSSQTGLEKKVRTDVVIRIEMGSSTGSVYINPDLGFALEQGDTAQESSAIAEASPDFDTTLSLAQQGGTANADSQVEGVQSQQDNQDNSEVDNSINDSQNPVDNSVDNTSTNTPAGEVDKVIDDSLGYNAMKKVEVSGSGAGGPNDRSWGRFTDGKTWGFNGRDFGPTALVKWPECKTELSVPNTSVNYDKNGALWVNGDFGPADEKMPWNGKNIGGVFSKAGCIATYYEVHYKEIK
jgi:hypothetical protein